MIRGRVLLRVAYLRGGDERGDRLQKPIQVRQVGVRRHRRRRRADGARLGQCGCRVVRVSSVSGVSHDCSHRGFRLGRPLQLQQLLGLLLLLQQNHLLVAPHRRVIKSVSPMAPGHGEASRTGHYSQFKQTPVYQCIK